MLMQATPSLLIPTVRDCPLFFYMSIRPHLKPVFGSIFIVIALVSASASCTASPDLPPGDPLFGSGDAPRRALTAEQLLNGFDYHSPVDESNLAVPEQAAQPIQTFEGRLAFQDEATVGAYQIIRDDYDYVNDPQRFHLPEFDFDFVQHGSHLIPVQRGRIVTEHPYWDYLLSPGRVWHENDDGEFERGAIPFALLQKNQNCTHNGTLMFLFNGDRISHAWYQITQETCPYFKTDMWGLLTAVYFPDSITGAEQIRSDYVQELRDRFPTAPLSALTDVYPDVNLDSFGSDISPEHLSLYGLVVDGVNYLGPCHTRYGDYGYCQEMRQASYSTAKSAFAGLAFMRLAQRDGLGVKDLLISDYAPEAASAAGDWSGVTFENTLDMATGNYQSPTYMVDESGPQMSIFFNVATHADKISQAFSWLHHKPPGETWVYHTSDTYILVRAMQNYLGSDAFDFLVTEVFGPLKIGPGAHSSARTSDNHWQGQAFGGYGLWWIADDVAKLATLLHNGGKSADGSQLLHPDLVAAALQRLPDDPGLLTGIGDRYHLGFWATRYTPEDDPAFECSFWTPYMSGVGGNTVLLLPNGMTYYYFSDNDEFAWLEAVKETYAMRSHCRFPVEIACVGEDVVLRWQARSQDARYRIWRSSRFDFAPEEADAVLLAEREGVEGGMTYRDSGVCADAQTNYAYRIEARDAEGVRTGLSGASGESLIPGY